MIILQCPRCGTLHDPSVTFSPRNQIYKMWQQALVELGLAEEKIDDPTPNPTY
jgi:hypothetical protein